VFLIEKILTAVIHDWISETTESIILHLFKYTFFIYLIDYHEIIVSLLFAVTFVKPIFGLSVFLFIYHFFNFV